MSEPTHPRPRDPADYAFEAIVYEKSPPRATIRLNRPDGRRRRGRLQSQDALCDPVATQHRGSRGTVGSHLQHAGHRQHAAAMCLRSDRHSAEMRTEDLRNPIVRRQPFVDHGVIGMDEVHDAAIVTQDFLKEGNRLFQHRVSQ